MDLQLLLRLVPRVGLPVHYSRGREIFGENDPAEYIYIVQNGAVRTCCIRADGRRLVSSFYFPGDVFGLEADDTHCLSAEATCASSTQLVRRTTLLTCAARDTRIANLLWDLTARELDRVQKHALLLMKSAPERVASFLIELQERLGVAEIIDLPMSRTDIADYLGLTIETISRMLWELERDATISLPNSRRVLVRNHDALCARTPE